MGFSSNCVIHDSNPRIWRRLISYGLHPNPCNPRMRARTEDNSLCIVVERDVFFCVDEKNLSENPYDCKDNEELFYALAALRDDTDIHQWFIYDNRDWNDDDPRRYWFICKQDRIEDMMYEDQMCDDCEKATRAELIAHFNGMDDDEVI